MTLTPLNETGQPVDWWFLYKVPSNAKGDTPGTPPSTGYEYAYYDNVVDKVQASPYLLSGSQGALKLTMASIFSCRDASLGYVLYNDERPEGCPGTDNGELGHTKGAIFFDTASQTAIWLLHSWPKFVWPTSTQMPTPMFGQTYLCLSLTLDDVQRLAGQMITHQQPQVFDKQLPAGLDPTSNLALLCGQINPADPGDTSMLTFTTRGGLVFDVIAKNRDWNQDFWNDLVGPDIHEDINVETWIRGNPATVIPSTKDSDNVHTVADIKYITLRALGLPWAWPEVQDHAKWAISHADNWICVGDINRMISQEKRGGCTVAFQDPDLWALLNQTDLLNVPTGMTTQDAVRFIQTTHPSPGTFHGKPLRTSFFHDNVHLQCKTLQPVAARTTYGTVVGTVETSTEHPITGRSGSHLQFAVNVGSAAYQVDTNVQSEDGSEVGVYISDEALEPATTNPPFGPEAYGFFPNASLSYKGMGLTDAEFQPATAVRLESQLEAALNASAFVKVYGFGFDDGGPNGKGIHENHFNPQDPGQDGGIAVYMVVNGNPVCRWFFFKFDTDHIGP